MREKVIRSIFKKYDIHDDVNRRQFYRHLNMEYHRAPHDINGKPSFHISDDFNNNLYQIEKFVRLVEETENLPYPKIHNGRKEAMSEKKRFLAYGMKNIKYWVGWHDTSLSYSPHVELFFQTVFSSSYPYEYSDSIVSRLMVGNKTLADKGNDFVVALRNGLNSPVFKKKICDQEENGYRQFSSSIKYVHKLLNRHSRLFHIRIDLAIDRLATSDNHNALCDILDYFTQFKKFLSRKKGAFEHLDGYIAHMEYGINKGHHIHISLFFYGQKVKSDYIITQKAKEAWLKITKGTGLFHSTNLDHRHPVCNALQQINRQDTSKLDCLYYVLWYIVKADQFLTYKYHKDQRLFFKGLL